MRQAAPQSEMLLPAQQSSHSINIGNVRRDDKRRHRKAGFPLETHLANKRADEAVSEIIHKSAAGAMVPEWQYGVIAMPILCTQRTPRGHKNKFEPIALRPNMLDLSNTPPYRRANMENEMTDTTPFVRPDVAQFLQFLNAAPGPKFWEVPAVEARAITSAMRDVADAPVGELAVIRDIAIPGPAGTIPARVYDSRADRAPGPVMVFYHGGGFVIGSLYSYEPYCAEVARLLDLPVISIDYRLSPEHPFPAPAEDCEAATRWIASSPAELGLNVTGLITSGDSAGGNLTIVTSMALRDKPAAVPVLVQFPIYPVVTLDTDWPSMRAFSNGYLLTEEGMAYFGEGHAAVPGDYRSEPLNFPQEGMPPSLVTTASLDPLRDQGLAYVEKLKQAGVKVQHISADGNIHGHINIRQAIPSVQADIEGYIKALKNMLAEVSPPA